MSKNFLVQLEAHEVNLLDQAFHSLRHRIDTFTANLNAQLQAQQQTVQPVESSVEQPVVSRSDNHTNNTELPEEIHPVEPLPEEEVLAAPEEPQPVN